MQTIPLILFFDNKLTPLTKGQMYTLQFDKTIYQVKSS